jgi:hypothetical protein
MRERSGLSKSPISTRTSNVTPGGGRPQTVAASDQDLAHLSIVTRLRCVFMSVM